MIDRHNYETYFILYLDNELAAEERRMVEEFAQNHPDLKEELDILLQFRVEPDTRIVFDGKEELMKENGFPLITTDNLEEWLCLSIDGELNPEQQTRLESYLVANPEAGLKLAILQKTKLSPESIKFPFKDSLYREEEKVRRIGFIRWRAIAAILVLALGLIGYLMFNGKKEPVVPGIAVKEPSRSLVQPETPDPEPTRKDVQVNTAGINPEKKKESVISPFTSRESQQAPVDPGNRILVADNKKINPVKPTITPLVKEPDLIKEEEALADNDPKPTNNLPRPLNNPNTSLQTGDALAVKDNPAPKASNIIPENHVTLTNAQPSDIINASYTEDKEMLEQTDGKKNRNRGFFRKIARTFEKRTNIDPTDDNRLLVAGLSIKLK